MAYTARRMRHVCSMKGCRNRDVVLVSKNGELGGGIYICHECIEGLQSFIPVFYPEVGVTPKEAKNEAKAEPIKETHETEIAENVAKPKGKKNKNNEE